MSRLHRRRVESEWPRRVLLAPTSTGRGSRLTTASVTEQVVCASVTGIPPKQVAGWGPLRECHGPLSRGWPIAHKHSTHAKGCSAHRPGDPLSDQGCGASGPLPRLPAPAPSVGHSVPGTRQRRAHRKRLKTLPALLWVETSKRTGDIRAWKN